MAKTRFDGLDIARSLAVFGMILVNFKIVLGASGPSWLVTFTDFFSGKAAATFVVLAGIGLSILYKNRRYSSTSKVYKKLLLRSAILFIAGLSYNVIWPADILHYYGIYILIALLFLPLPSYASLVAASVTPLVYLFLILVLDYEVGWDFTSLTYTDFWTPAGFVRNLFFNGFHPVIPWVAFMLLGVAIGKLELSSLKLVKRVFFISILALLLIEIISWQTTKAISLFSYENNDLKALLETSPMPPLPLYMLSGASFALLIISGCLWISLIQPGNIFLRLLRNTGKLALTLYILHVIIGMGAPLLISPNSEGTYGLVFSTCYAILFSMLSIITANLWLTRFKLGPFEWLMRKVSG